MIRNSIKFVYSQLLSLGAFLGHLKRRRNNYMSLYFYGVRCGMICFNLSYTTYNMRRAIAFFLEAISHRGIGFFLAGNLGVAKQWFLEKSMSIVRYCCWYVGPYIGGLVSNFNHVKRNYGVTRCSNMCDFLGLPSVVLVFDSNEYFNGFREAYARGVPSIGLVDSDLEYRDVSYPIFMNNDTFRIKFFFCHFFCLLIVYQKAVERLFIYSIRENVVKKKIKKYFKLVRFKFRPRLSDVFYSYKS